MTKGGNWKKGTEQAAVAAHDAYEEALKLEPTNEQAKSGMNAVKRAIDAEAKADGVTGDPLGGLGGMFNDPQLFEKLAKNPKTAALLADRDFMEKLQRVKQNPNSIGNELGDPRFLQVMSVLLGIDMSYGAPGENGGSSRAAEAEQDVPMPDAPRASTSSEPKKAPEPAPAPEPEPEDEETLAKKKAREQGDAEKKIGNDFYKKKQFDEAIEHYEKAWELNKDITYLNNIGAAKFEKGDYQGAIEICKKAVEESREYRTDFKTLAKYVPPGDYSIRFARDC